MAVEGSRTVAIVQARMTSTRLPGKVLADINGQPALEHVIRRVRRANTLDDVVVATTVNVSDEPIVHLCRKLGVHTFRGDEDDVLHRMYEAAVESDCQNIVRITADCPMIDPEIIDACVTEMQSRRWDYVSNCNERTYPDGLDTEVLTLSALQEANQRAVHPFLREHVTPYIRGIRPELGMGTFRLHDIKFAADFSHVRWTLDTHEDLARIRELVANLPPDYTWLHALSIATRQPHLLGPA